MRKRATRGERIIRSLLATTALATVRRYAFEAHAAAARGARSGLNSLLLACFALATLPPGLAVAEGPLTPSVSPEPGAPESYSPCLTITVAPEVLQIGQTVTAKFEPHPDQCSGEVHWNAAEALRNIEGPAIEGCGQDERICKKRARPGTELDRWLGVCVAASTGYYPEQETEGARGFHGHYACSHKDIAVINECKGSPALKAAVKRKGRATYLYYRGGNWDYADCGPVRVGALLGRYFYTYKTLNSSSFSGVEHVPYRVCGVSLVAEQFYARRRRTAGNRNDRQSQLVVSYATPAGASSERLYPGDRLCKSTIPQRLWRDPNSLDAGDVVKLARKLGQRVLGVQTPRQAYTMDTERKVDVQGRVLEQASPSLLQMLSVVGEPLSQLLASSYSPKLELSSVPYGGLFYTLGDLLVDGNLTMGPGVTSLTVRGNLRVTGTVIMSAESSISATGSVVIDGGVDHANYAPYPLVAGGGLTLP